MSTVTLTLDTTAPQVSVEAPRTVEPPGDLVLALRADEALGPVSVALVDAEGHLSQLGFERTSPSTVRVVIPTHSLPRGELEVMFSVADEVLNVTRRTIKVRVSGTAPFQTELSIEPSFAVEPSFEVDHFHVELSVNPSFEVELTWRYDPIQFYPVLSIEPSFEVSLSRTRGDDV